jgi:catechol 2,3-dioxygenase-like lactoylglutathione lyase family enzyme
VVLSYFKLMERLINGIQQVGIGVKDAKAAFDWYKKIFGTDIVVFKDTAVASLMQKYTGNVPQKRFAILAMNMQGGGGFEIWQYIEKEPARAAFEPALGDTGIFAVKIRCRDISSTYHFYVNEEVNILNKPCLNPEGKNHFYIKDPWNNIFELIEDDYWFMDEKKLTGAVMGVVVGTTDIYKATRFYKEVLGFTTEVYNDEGIYTDWNGVNGSDSICRRIILKRNWKATGAFGKLLGPVQIELVKVESHNPKKIFENRHWGDLGFIHVCFDVNGMQQHERICAATNYPLSVNSADSFDMGKAAGHFSYNEDPDGTLIEYVETHKVPVAKKWGLFLNLKKRNAEKCLPNWVVKCLRFSREK